MTDEQMIEALATKVMGWSRNMPEHFAAGSHWEGSGRPLRVRDPRALNRWNPLTNPADSKMVREKLAELGWQKGTLQRRPPEEGHLFSYGVCTRKTGWVTELAHTEERAVAKAALRTVGVDPTPSPQ